MSLRLKYNPHFIRCFQRMIPPLLYPYTRCFTSCFYYYHFGFITLFVIKMLNG